MEKIRMKTPLVEMDGDEMTRVIWKMIKEKLLLPFIDLKTEYFDLGLVHRNETNDKITVKSAEATKKYGVAVKCATITPNAARMPEYNLKEMWKSPNGTIRAILDGTVFRAPIIADGIVPYIPTWTKPIKKNRNAYGDVYKNTELRVDQGCKAELRWSLYTILQTATVLFRDFTTKISLLKALHVPVSTMPLIPNRIYGLLQRILYQKNMTIGSRIFLQKSLKRNIKTGLKPQVLNTSIRLLMMPSQE